MDSLGQRSPIAEATSGKALGRGGPGQLQQAGGPWDKCAGVGQAGCAHPLGSATPPWDRATLGQEPGLPEPPSRQPTTPTGCERTAGFVGL